jgi:putative addiction module component (TIGR02574 family)
MAVKQGGCSLRSVTGSIKKLGIDRLNVEQRLALIEEIWESIEADDATVVQLSDAKHAEIRAHLAEDDTFPEDALTMEEIEASLLLPRGRK